MDNDFWIDGLGFLYGWFGIVYSILFNRYVLLVVAFCYMLWFAYCLIKNCDERGVC